MNYVSRPVFVLLMLAGALTALVVLPDAPVSLAQRARGDCAIDESLLDLDPIEQRLQAEINRYRRELGVPELEISWLLTRAAVWKSTDRARGGPEEHDDVDRTWDQRFDDCGYDFDTAKGENLAKVEGADLPPDQEPGLIVQAWKDSPEHNRVMSDPAYLVIGLARVRVEETKTVYWTTVFGAVADADGVHPYAASPASEGGDAGMDDPAAAP